MILYILPLLGQQKSGLIHPLSSMLPVHGIESSPQSTGPEKKIQISEKDIPYFSHTLLNVWMFQSTHSLHFLIK